MPGTWFVGDTHFGHLKVAQIRGFESAAEHDDVIFSKWTRQVRDGDTVFVLGDISSGSSGGEDHALSILENLPGHKHLICGNHDSISSIHRNGYKKQAYWFRVFDSIRDYGRIRIEGADILLSHYPYASSGDGPGRGEPRYMQFRLPDLGGYLIHAHTHHAHPTSGSSTGREYCVSWDAHRRLVNLGDIAAWIKEES